MEQEDSSVGDKIDNVSKLGLTVNYKIELDDYNRWKIILPSTFKGIKPICKSCNYEPKSGERLYFCERDRIFLCRECVLSQKHQCYVTEDQHEDKPIELEIEEGEDG